MYLFLQHETKYQRKPFMYSSASEFLVIFLDKKQNSFDIDKSVSFKSVF